LHRAKPEVIERLVRQVKAVERRNNGDPVTSLVADRPGQRARHRPPAPPPPRAPPTVDLPAPGGPAIPSRNRPLAASTAASRSPARLRTIASASLPIRCSLRPRD